MKFIREYCSICKRELDMPVVQEEEANSRLLWVRCPSCLEIKPIGGSPETAAAPGEVGGRQSDAAVRRVVRHYRAGERFLTGEWIYHPEWNDTGQVIEKCRSKGGRDVIVVSFQRLGTKRLVNNFAS